MQSHQVLVLGLGASGLAMARWCARLGAQVCVADTREAPPQLPALQSELPAVRFLHAPLDAALLDQAGLGGAASSLLLKSPGIAPHAWRALRQAAQQRGVAIGGELSLFAQTVQALAQERAYAPKLLAITGTNGKTTVTSLTGQLLARAGKRVAVAGNIGPTLLDTLAQALDSDALPEIWVMELSSFQLDADSLPAPLFDPTAAALLNITQDHLDWHETMPAYAAAKARIFGAGTLAVANRDDPLVMAALQLPVRKVSARKSAQAAQAAQALLAAGACEAAPSTAGSGPSNSDAMSTPAEPTLREHVSFGDNAPTRPGDYGVETVNGMAWLARALPLEPQARRRAAKASMRGKTLPEEELFIQRLMPLEALRIRGRHNAMNALAALALAESAGCTLASLLHGLREYRGEPHRVEPVAIIADVEWFDDSKGTNVGATVAALNGLGVERKLVVILGGEGKGQDFAPLAAPFKRYARAGVLIGRDAPLIRAQLKDCGPPLIDAASMEQAVEVAAQQARPGDAVLMSPACASFDMFDNYGHRAKVFRAAVQSLAQTAGQVLEGAL